MYTPPSPLDNLDKYDEPRLHMERLMRARLIEFDIQFRVVLMLDNAGIKTLGDLTKCKEEDLLSIRNFGVTSLAKIKKFLSDQDLSLAQ